MNAQGCQRIEAIIQGALERNPGERAPYLRQVCDGDTALLEEVEALLSFESVAGPRIAGAVQGTAALFQRDVSRFAEGQRIGVYRVVREIGRGGMGTVYLAERDDEQFRKQVAIKLVTRGMDTAELLRRFRHERQILARLEHPYIARLLDGGSTEDGRPFLVMEYVQGIAITSYCDDHGLGTRQRIELFLKVCAAVQSAHQNLVVHRDLKPGNILVDSQGLPKLLDFGVAKLLGPDDGSEFTIATDGMRMLTPHYASPEQVRGGAITTAADVYALGVILYELVAGVRPHRLQNYSPAEIERAVCEENPERPSTASRRAAATADTGPRSPLKPDELDNIVLMAMQKEPARRYGSAAEFAEDLRRYLDGLPVRAREDTLSYRARKFIRRYRTGVAAAVLLVATLAGGVAVSTMEARRAQRRFDEVRRIAHAVLYDIHDAIRDLPGSVKAREVVVKTALQYLDGLAREAGGDAGIQLELADAYQRVGDVQGNAIDFSLGKTADALESYHKAQKIADELALSHPTSAKIDVIRLTVRERIGDVLALMGDIAGALKIYSEGAEIGESVASRDPSNRENQSSLASLYIARAGEDHDSSRAIANARKGVSILERMAAAERGSAPVQERLLDGYSVLSSVLKNGNHLEEALQEALKVVLIREGLVAAHPQSTHSRHELMVAYGKVGDAASGSATAGQPLDPSLALQNHRKALALAEALAAADPADRRAIEERGMALVKMGGALSDKDLTSGIAMMRRAQADFRTLAEAEPGEVRILRRFAATYMFIGRRLAGIGDAAGAEANLREAIRICEDLTGKHSKDLVVWRYLGRSYQDLAKALANERKRTEALEASDKAIGAAEAARTVDSTNAVTQSLLPQAYAAAGAVHAILAEAPGPRAQRREDWIQAQDAYQKSVSAWERIQTQGAGPNNWGDQLAKARAEIKRCTVAAAAIR